METYSPWGRRLANHVHPGRETARLISQEFANGKTEIPAYMPYVAQISRKHRAQQTQDHTIAIENWRKFSRRAKRPGLTQELSIQAWLLDSARFLIAADFWRAFEIFGGLAARLNRLCAALGLSITESASAATNYDRAPEAKLQEKTDCETQTHPSLADRYHQNISNIKPNRPTRSAYRITELNRRIPSQTAGGKAQLTKSRTRARGVSPIKINAPIGSSAEGVEKLHTGEIPKIDPIKRGVDRLGIKITIRSTAEIDFGITREVAFDNVDLNDEINNNADIRSSVDLGWLKDPGPLSSLRTQH